VVPSGYRAEAERSFAEKNGCGFSFGDGCHGSDTHFNLFDGRNTIAIHPLASDPPKTEDEHA